MPIYEFYCHRCNTIFNFFTSTINTDKVPRCPRCKRVKLKRQMSIFSSPKGGGDEEGDLPFRDMDESRMEQAMNMLMGEAEKLDENDPKAQVSLMRKLADATGLKFGPGMEDALRRIEAGEDPDQVGEEMENLDEDELFVPKDKGGIALKQPKPKVDDKLYYLD